MGKIYIGDRGIYYFNEPIVNHPLWKGEEHVFYSHYSGIYPDVNLDSLLTYTNNDYAYKWFKVEHRTLGGFDLDRMKKGKYHEGYLDLYNSARECSYEEYGLIVKDQIIKDSEKLENLIIENMDSFRAYVVIDDGELMCYFAKIVNGRYKISNWSTERMTKSKGKTVIPYFNDYIDSLNLDENPFLKIKEGFIKLETENKQCGVEQW